VILVRWLAVVAVVLAAGCARPATERTVPPGCEPTAGNLTWSPSTITPTLTNASLNVGATQTTLLDEPFQPSITGVDAPEAWLGRLAASLQKFTDHPVLAKSPEPKPTALTYSAPGGALVIIYTGVDRVTADFEARCDPAVRGTFHGWSTATTGVVSCHSYQPDPPDAFDSLALNLCPAPTPAPSNEAEAVPTVTG
jgi:hypothetical protein